jgi:hypothetical protein
MEQAHVFQAIAGTVYMFTMAVVGFRLLSLWRRSREAPEFLLGLSLILGGVFGAVLEASALAVNGEAPPFVVGQLLLAGKAFGIVGIACQGLFTQRVFRPGARGAKLLLAAILAIALTSLCGYMLHGTFSTGELPTQWVLFEFFGRVGTPCWLLFEAARYHHVMKRRMRLGLADPVVTNRFLVWALAGAFSLMMFTTSLPPMFLDATRYAMLLNGDLIVFSITGIVAAALYWVTFFPPATYQRWLRVRAQALTAAPGV